MSTLRNNDIVYTTTVGSDVSRDGFYSELCRVTESGPVFVAEAYWSDPTNEFVVTVAESPIPFSVLESFLIYSRARVPPKAIPQESNYFGEETPE